MRIGHDHAFEVATALDVRIWILLGKSHQLILDGSELEAHLTVFERSLHLPVLIPAIPC